MTCCNRCEEQERGNDFKTGKQRSRWGESGTLGLGSNDFKKKSEETGEELWESLGTFSEPAVGSKSNPTLSLSLYVCVSAPLINNNSKSDLKRDTWF